MSVLKDKEKLLSLMRQLVEACGEAKIRDLDKQIKEMIGQEVGLIYKKEGKLNCHAALDFLKAAEKSFSALAGDLKEMAGKLDPAKDSRQPVLRALRAKMERLVGEMQEVFQIINRINRF